MKDITVDILNEFHSPDITELDVFNFEQIQDAKLLKTDLDYELQLLGLRD